VLVLLAIFLARPQSCRSDSDCSAAKGFICQPLTGSRTYRVFDGLFFAAISEWNPSAYEHDIRDDNRTNCAATSKWLTDTTYFLDRIGQTRPGSPTICVFNASLVVPPWDPNAHLRSWLRRAYGGVKHYPDYDVLLMDFFKAWSP